MEIRETQQKSKTVPYVLGGIYRLGNKYRILVSQADGTHYMFCLATGTRTNCWYSEAAAREGLVIDAYEYLPKAHVVIEL